MSTQAYIDNLVTKSKKAQAILADFNQEQIDAMVKAIGYASVVNAEALSEKAVEETEFGTIEMKSMKHVLIGKLHWQYLKGKKSVGVLEENIEENVITYARPMGVLASITPMTNPTTTAIQNTMIAVKSGNTVIVAPHPKAKECTKFAVKIMNDAIVSVGGPENVVQSIEEPSIEASQILMKSVHAILATGGPGMVNAAYSSGHPAFGVGQGNVQTIIDTSVPDLNVAVAYATQNRAFDFGVPCTSDQTVYVPKSMEQAFIASATAQKNRVFTEPEDVDKMRKAAFVDGGAVNTALVGKPAVVVAKMVGLEDVDPDTVTLIFKLENPGVSEPLSRELLTTVLRYAVYDDDKFEDVVELARTVLLKEGAGHTSILHTTDQKHIDYAGKRLPVGRLLINQMGVDAGGCTVNNGLVPTISLGCGTDGNNSISENLTYYHLLNKTKISMPIKDAKDLSIEEVFAD